MKQHDVLSFARRSLAAFLCVSLSGAPALAQPTTPAPKAPASEPAAPGSSGEAEPEQPQAAPETTAEAAEGRAETEAVDASKPLSETLTGEAKAAYDEGKLLYMDGDYAGATLKFQAAYETSKDYRLLWNMVAAQKNLRNYAHAIDLLDRYLAEGGGQLSAEDRDEALALRQVMTPFVGELTIKVNEPGATVYLDGKQVGVTPLAQSLRLNMGNRKIRVEKPGFEPFTVEENIRGGSDAALEVTLQKKVTDGTLVIYAGASDEIRVDGEVVGTGTFTGQLSAGAHHIGVTAPGKVPYESDVVVEVGQRSTVRVTLESMSRTAAPMADQEKGGMPGWAWGVIGGALAIGGGLAAFFIVRNNNDSGNHSQAIDGTIPPGNVQLPVMVRY